MHPEVYDAAAFERAFKEHVIVVDVHADQRGPSSIWKVGLRTGAIASAVRIIRPVALNAGAYFTMFTGPQAPADSRRYPSSS
jgi:hypothetical protein